MLAACRSSSGPCTKDRSLKHIRMYRDRLRDIKLCQDRKCNRHRRRSRRVRQSCTRRKDGILCLDGGVTLGRTPLCSRSVHVLNRVPVRSKPKQCLWVEILQLVSNNKRNVAENGLRKFSDIFKTSLKMLSCSLNFFRTI